MARVLRTQLARKDLKDIGEFIARESSSYDVAFRFLDRITDRCELYATRPEIGEPRPELGENVRRFTVGNYVVIYRTITGGIQLLRVVHGHRDVEAFFPRD